ncbi:ran-specific GTPase-activating protein-like [Oppia nitens]|uniref:ran-specific GTPase-activating protein-like n=1 Tax=Oppia nitens TaxID=1686743 RepID=UPI0023DA9102|nr:ran-specific GTPase-activating protein-like [Oppia nitens]
MSESVAQDVDNETKSDSHRERTESESNESNPDIHFDPIIQLPLVDFQTLEENEEEVLKLRAKLYRFDDSEETPQFKERGTGEIKILKHREIRAVRILMRRDKTLKLCANHYIMPHMELKNHQNSEKVFVWNTFADLSDETPSTETLAIRFGNIENAQKFKQVFEECKEYVSEKVDYDITSDLSKISLIDKQNDDNTHEEESDNVSDKVVNTDTKDENKTKEETKEEVKESKE